MSVMYLEHFGLREAPFGITPHTGFFFTGAHRGATLEALIYAITQDEGIVKVSGEVGSGKTMLCRMLLTRLPANAQAVYLDNPSLRRDEILHTIADELGVQLNGKRRHVLLRSLQEKLLEVHAAGKLLVVLVDEAHAMSMEALEEIRQLSNLESAQHKLLHIVLFGQPELDRRLIQSNMRQLKERITHNFALEPLFNQDVRAYLAFRLRVAGYNGPDIFSPKAIQLISQASKGMTRRINILADKAMLSAYSENKCLVDTKQLKSAISDAPFTAINPKVRRPIMRWASYGVSIFVCLGGVYWLSHDSLVVSHAEEMSVAQPLTEPPSKERARLNSADESALLSSVEDKAHVAMVSYAADNTAFVAPPSVRKDITGHEKPPENLSVAAFLTLEQRFEATLNWLHEVSDTHLFVQLLSVDAQSRREVEAFVRYLEQTLDPTQIRVYRSKLSGRERIGVIYGDYATPEEAKIALAKVMRNERLKNSYIRSVQKLR